MLIKPARVGSDDEQSSKCHPSMQVAFLDTECQHDAAKEDNVRLLEISHANLNFSRDE